MKEIRTGCKKINPIHTVLIVPIELSPIGKTYYMKKINIFDLKFNYKEKNFFKTLKKDF